MRPEHGDIADLFGFVLPQGPSSEATRRRLPTEGRTAAESAEIAAAHLADGNVAEAVRHYKRAIEQKGGEDPHLALDLAAAHEFGGDLPAAIEQYLKALQSAESSLEAGLGLSSVLRQEGRYREAIERLEQALEAHPADPYLWAKMAELLREAGWRKKALEAIQRAVTLKPEEAHFHFWCGDLLIAMGRYEEALRSLRAAVELSPGDDHFLLLSGVAFWRLGRHKDAVRAVDFAKSLDQDEPAYGALLAILRVECEMDPQGGAGEAFRGLDEYAKDRVRRWLDLFGIPRDRLR
ncbi:MAG: tetratricopeptide repeat protein [Fimbriimonadales bacterium]|nr:tetratricopeptide repeat protein [Fimbriimonadales bacterium]